VHAPLTFGRSSATRDSTDWLTWPCAKAPKDHRCSAANDSDSLDSLAGSPPPSNLRASECLAGMPWAPRCAATTVEDPGAQHTLVHGPSIRSKPGASGAAGEEDADPPA
jgi:hypothetical protein